MDEKLVEVISKITVKEVFETLRKNGFEIKERKNSFQNTEQLLYLMPQLKNAINHNKKKIEDLKKYGLSKNTSAVHIAVTGTTIKLDDTEIIEKEISKLLQRNYLINSNIKWINGVLETIRSDEDYEIIELKYFQGKTREEIAEYFSREPKTITRNKNRLINKIKILLFANDSMNELGC